MGQWFNNASSNERDSFENAIKSINSGTLPGSESITLASGTALTASSTSGWALSASTSGATGAILGQALGALGDGIVATGLSARGFYASTSGATGAVVAQAQSTGPALIAIGSSGAIDASLGAAIQAKFAANVAGASIAPLNLVASTASQAFISFSGVFISSASYGGLANTNAFVIPVYHESQKIWGYIGCQKALI